MTNCDCDCDMAMFYNVLPSVLAGWAYTQYESQLRDFNYALRGVKRNQQQQQQQVATTLENFYQFYFEEVFRILHFMAISQLIAARNASRIQFALYTN